MTVYVDDVRHRFREMVMCHMWADTEDELHRMAAAIGVARRWVQRPPMASWLHYDISLSRKRMALDRGAILTDMFGPTEFLARADIASGDPARQARGERMLASVANSRKLRDPAQGELL